MQSLGINRLSVHRTPRHTYAQVFSGETGKVVASASTLSADVKKEIKYSGNIDAAAAVGKVIAEKAKAPVSRKLPSIVRVLSITAGSRHWLTLLVKTV